MIRNANGKVTGKILQSTFCHSATIFGDKVMLEEGSSARVGEV